jgi:hypothetical protein
MRAMILLGMLALFAQSCAARPFTLLTGERPSGSVLFQDNFSDPSSGWERRPDDPDGFLDYTGGIYRIQVNTAQRMLWSGPGLEFTDLRVEVDAIRVAGPQDDDFGIVCRASDQANFYFLAISSDGYFGIGKVKDGEAALIGAEAMPPSEAIYQGRATNHLRADCTGDHLSLYANGTLLATVQDSDFSSGEAGLLVGAFAEPGTEVYFDNFTALKP